MLWLDEDDDEECELMVMEDVEDGADMYWEVEEKNEEIKEKNEEVEEKNEEVN